MPRSWIKTGLALIGLAIGLLFTFIMGLYAYVTATARPLHPNPQAVQSVRRSAPSPKWADAVQQAQQIVRTGLTEQNLPGLSVAVGIGNDIVWAEGFGYADLEKRVFVTPETRFRIGNASNALTSAAVGRLVQKGRLNLDADIQVYVPAFPQKQWPVTLRQLMGHLAGVRNDAGDEEPLSERCERTVDGLQRFADSRLLFEPGTQYRSSSYGWILVSAAVEEAAGQPFFAFMRKEIFEPLDMTSTRPDLWTEPIPDRATFYFPRFAGEYPLRARAGARGRLFLLRGRRRVPVHAVRPGAVRDGRQQRHAAEARHRRDAPDATAAGLGRGDRLRSWLEARDC